MDKRDWTLIALAMAEGKPLSPVQLQKAVFLFSKKLPEDVLPESFYHFTPYNYGPFDSAVYDDVRSLASNGLTSSEEAVGGSYKQYRATETGILQAASLVSMLPPDVQKHAKALVDWIRAQSFTSLVSAVYKEYPEYKVNSVFRS